MKKKVYNQPMIDIMSVHVENVMLNVSTNPGGGGGGDAHAPARQGDIIG